MQKLISILKNKVFINCKKIYGQIGILEILFLLQIGLELITPRLYSYFFDDVIAKKSIENLRYLIGGYCLLYLMSFIVGIILKETFFRFRKSIVVNTRLAVWKKIEQLPYDKYISNNNSEWRSRIDSDSENVFTYFFGNIVELPILVAKMVLIIIVIFLKCYWLTLIMVPFIFFVLEVQKKVEATSYSIYQKLREKKNVHTQWLYDVLPNYQDIKVNNLHKKFTREYLRQRHEIVKMENERSLKSFMPNFIFFEHFNTLYMDKIVLYALCGIVLLKYGNTSVGEVLAYMSYYSSLAASLKLYNQKVIFNKGMEPAVEKVCELFYEEEYVDYLKYDSNSEYIIKFDNVSFGYADKKIINDFVLDIKKGEKIRLLGKSGAGKSTIIKLLLGFYNPSKGNVVVAFKNYDEYSKKIGVIFQEPVLYNCSIKDNLKRSCADVNDGEIESVCRMVGIHDYICSLENKYDSIVGENGVLLSGGQKQLLQLAKLLLKNPEIIILDESTSAMDAENEVLINRVLEEFMKDKTCIVISHRKMSDVGFSRTIVLENA